jgi:hypothetical protein
MTPFALPVGADTVTTSPPSGVFVGDSFYIVYGIRIGAFADAVQLVRIRTTGSVVDLGNQVAASESPKAPSLVAGATDLRVTYVSAVGPGVRWLRLGLAGEELSQSVLISQPGASERWPAVAFGDDAIVLLAGSKGTSLGAARVSKAGQVMAPTFPIARTRDALEAYQVVRAGPGVVAAWLATRTGASSRIGLARVVP